MRITSLILLTIAVACRATPDHPGQHNRLDFAAVDSIVLERSPCLGTCPAYRLSIASNGRVHFRSRAPSERRMATDSIASTAVTQLVREAERIGFATLPSSILGDPQVCGNMWTDFPSVTISVFAGARTVAVADYLGCHGPTGQPQVAARLRRLRSFEDAIDNVARVGRWIR